MDQHTLSHPPLINPLEAHQDTSLVPAADEIRLTHSELAESLNAQGEMALLKEDLFKAVECFDSALRLDSSNPKIYYMQGLAFFEFGRGEGREKAFFSASKKFKAATTLDPTFFDAWQAWGSLLCSLGLHFEEHHYFLQAKEKLNTAASLAADQKKDILSELYWDLGIVFSHLAEHSEEALDWHQAIEAFQTAESFGEKLPADFWCDFGHASLQFASQINDSRIYFKAIQAFKNALSLEGNNFDSWNLLAETFQKLYEQTHDEEHFAQGNESFASAAQIQPKNGNLWLNWAKFLTDSAKRIADAKRLRMSLEKCHRAAGLMPNEPMVQAIWGETLALLGNYTERLDLLYEAENKLLQAIEIDENHPDIWYSYGICLQAFGHYFDDADYYYQAIEKFQEGLSIDRTCHRNWHAIGWTYSLLGELEDSPETAELSFRFFQKALDLHSSSYYLFDYAAGLSKLGEMTQEQSHLENAIVQFENLLAIQKNALYVHPDWLFQYACTLDALGDFYEEDFHYLRAIEIFSHVLMVDPDFTLVHHRLGVALSHLGELTSNTDSFYRAIHHFRLSLKNDEENDTVYLDWATALMHLAGFSHDATEADQFYEEAQRQLQTALRLGNLHTYYHLACLFSLTNQMESGMQALEKARFHNALPPIDEILQDEWLDNLRSTGDFQHFLS